jgi:hypothetical protein
VSSGNTHSLPPLNHHLPLVRSSLCLGNQISYPLDLGPVMPADNTLTLRVEVVGRNSDAQGAGTFFGLDCLDLKEP